MKREVVETPVVACSMCRCRSWLNAQQYTNCIRTTNCDTCSTWALIFLSIFLWSAIYYIITVHYCPSVPCFDGLQPVPASSVSEGRVQYTLSMCFSAILTYVDIFKFTPVGTLQTISGNLETLIVYQCDNGKSHLKVWLLVCAASFALLIFPPIV